MKKFLIIFLFAFSILINAQSDPNIKWLHASPQGNDLKWMKMWDANNWYLGGQTGMFMKTTDAGLTWTTNNRAGWPHTTYPGILTNWQGNAAWFFDQNNGIVGGSNTSGILKTTNGGETFDTLRILPGGNTGKSIYSIYFVNSNLGFISGNTAYKVHITTDGGATWTQVPNLPDGAYNDVYATDELNIIACGPPVASQAAVYKTTDGGINWNTILLPTAATLYDLEFINVNTGYVCGSSGFFKSTTDGGETWTGGVNTPLAASNYKIKAANNEIYVAGNATNLFKSTDNGQSWITLNMNPSGSLYTGPNYCMDVVGSNVVVAGRYGNIYKSINSGTSWDILLEQVTSASFLRSFYVENTSGKIIVAGRFGDLPGTIIISNDGGNSWIASPQTIPFDNLLQKMQMFDNNNGYFSGQYGYFAKTTDGGISLTQIVIPFAGINFLYDMDFINQSAGWVVGGIPNGSGMVAKTTDGGVTWIDQTPVGTVGVGRVDFVDANIGYISSDVLRKTTNGGSSWSIITIPGLIGGINCITAFDANNVYINTSSSEFFKTTNGGTNWQSVPVPFTGNSIYNRGRAWYDMNNGIIYGVFGAIAKTTDAGQTWETMNTGGESIAGGIMVHPDTFYVGSFQYAQIFRYAKPSAQTTFQLSVNVSNGWNMVSIPGLHPTNQNVSTWWPGLTGTVWGFNGVQYVGKTIATPGEGYWMKHIGATVYNYPAIQIVAHTPLNALSGWNMIGGYENSVATIGLVTSPPNQITGTIWGFNGVQYVAANTLVPGYSYWVKLLPGCPCTITIPEALAKGSGEAVELFKEDWGRIILTDAAGLSYTLYAVKGEVDLDQYEMPPMPPAGMFDIRFSSGRIAEDLSNSQSIEMQGIAYPVKVKVENMNITLQDETGKELHTHLKPGEEITIDNNKISKLTVLSGEIIAPIEYALEQNYPNPFNPSTTIKFSLPEAADVTLNIYNTLGQKVAELVNGKLDAGRYDYQWNASNVATGMYIYELRSDKFVSVKKMILLK